jgi:hypothetical protein
MDRFDDVETRIVEEPTAPVRRPQRQRRIGPAALAVVAAAALLGSLAAGASALTSTAQAPTRTVEKTVQGHHGLCHEGEGHRVAAVDF